jgi:hypothetical protein
MPEHFSLGNDLGKCILINQVPREPQFCPTIFSSDCYDASDAAWIVWG